MPGLILPDVDHERLRRYTAWLADANDRLYTRATRVPLGQLSEWDARPGAAAIRHRTGRFFAIEGLDARDYGERPRRWQQPILVQPDVGTLGLVVAARDGMLHALVQAKPEPGNCNGLQVAPTVQATHSNYSRAHGGRPVPFLDLVVESVPRRILSDTRQSEHGGYFLQKRNRNIVVMADADIPPPDGFSWLGFPELYRLLAVDDLVSMDLRTVLGCLPRRTSGADQCGEGSFGAALARSASPSAPARHCMGELLQWITATRCRHFLEADRLPLPNLSGWHHDAVLAREDGLPFAIIGVEVDAAGREVGAWSQPMVEVAGVGLFALVTSVFDGVLHLLMQLHGEPGLVDVMELAPSVQLRPGDPPTDDDQRDLHELVVAAPADQVRFDTTLSEEGGRFYHVRNRHLIVQTPVMPEPPGHRWMTLDQIDELLLHSHYLSVQARSLVCCLRSLMGLEEPTPEQ